jgi:predicted nucleic acid-binding protein
MILVDTSVWIDHFRNANPILTDALNRNDILVHPFVTGELACGNLENRSEILARLGVLTRAPVATDSEALALIERYRLMGQGIGYVDVHLLASALLMETGRFWTRDRRLRGAAKALKVAFVPPKLA